MQMCQMIINVEQEDEMYIVLKAVAARNVIRAVLFMEVFMAATRIIPLHVNKGKTVAKCLSDRTDYSENEKKTENGKYISSYECDPKTCDREFLLTKREYLHIHGFDYKRNVIAYQIRQSFKPGEVTPEEANQIGYETAMRWTKGKHAFIVATHVDRAHIHNHIIYNSTTLDCERKWRDFLRSGKALQKVSDLVCLEHGLSVITPRPYGERTKYNNPSFRASIRDMLRADIEDIMRGSLKSFQDLLQGLREKDYEIKQGKNIAFRKKGNKRFLRLDTLGAMYSEDNLKRRIMGEEVAGATLDKKRDFDLVLDIQDIIKKNKGENYERWAKRFNLKQVAKALCFIREHGIKSLSELIELTDNAAKRFDELTESMKAKQKRLEEIAETKKQIANYAKTRETYEAYKKSGYSKKFFEAHREELLLHKAAKEFFDEQHFTKLPKMKDLSEEYGRILAEKRKEYAEYKSAKASMQDFMIARQNLESVLNSDSKIRDEKKDRNAQQTEK